MCMSIICDNGFHWSSCDVSPLNGYQMSLTYQLLLVTNFSDKLVALAVEFRSLPYLRDALVYHNYNLSGPLHAVYILYTRQSGSRLPGPMPGTIYQGMPWKLLSVERPLGKFAMVS